MHPSGVELLRDAADVELDYIEDTAHDAFIPNVFQAEAVLLRTQPFPEALIGQCRDLKIVSRHGVGYDAVDVPALNARQIPLAVVGDVISRTVAEHAMLLLLAAGKHLLRYDAAARGDWKFGASLTARDLHDKNLLVIGYGRIGRRLGALASAFGMRLHVYDPYAAIDDDSVQVVADLDAALPEVDFISVHIPKTGEPLLNRSRLGMLKPTAVIVNTARGGLVDEDALLEALAEGKLGAAGLDVFQQEPLPSDHPLTKSDRVILTPHVAALTLESAERMAVAAAQNIIDYFAGTLDPALVVNAEAIGFGQQS